MKMGKVLKKILGMSCAAIIACTAVGCGGNGGGGGGGKGGGGSSGSYGYTEDPNFQAESIYEADGRYRYDGGDGMDDNRLTFFRWSFGGLNSGREDNSPIYQKLKQAAGMDLYGQNVSASDWKTTLTTMYATQTLPDVFVSMGPETPENYSEMIDDGVLLPISDYVDATHWPNIYNYLKKFDYLRANLPYAQKKHWAIPVTWQLEHSLYIRLDWIDNLNAKLATCLADELGRAPTAQELVDLKYKTPETLTEFYRLSRAFTLYDPDGNGLKDTYGYTNGAKDDFFPDCWIFEAFEAGYDRMVKVGDSYTSSWANDNTKKAIAFLNNFVNSGYIDPSWYENDMSGKQEAFTRGKVGMYEGHVWYNTILRSFLAANDSKGYTIEQASDMIGMFAPPKGENGSYGIKGNPNFWTVTCLNAGMSDAELEACLNLFNYMLSDEGQSILTYGIENVHYTINNAYPTTDSRHWNSLLRDKQGKTEDQYGFKLQLSSVDYAAEIGPEINYSLGYLSPYVTNADKILSQMKAAESYLRYEDYAFLSPDSYVQYFEQLKDFALVEMMKMIRSNAAYTPITTKGAPSWSELNNLANNNSLTSLWNTYVNSFMNAQHGSILIQDYNDAISQGAWKVQDHLA